MGSEGITRLQLSVWRPARIERNLDYATAAITARDPTVFDVSRLQEEIYHWHPGQEDVWGCFHNPSVATELRDLFIEGFAPNSAPEHRSMERFREAVERLRAALENEESSSWADMAQVVEIRRSDSVNYRANSALSLLIHLEWIIRTFETVPGASVTIR